MTPGLLVKTLAAQRYPHRVCHPKHQYPPALCGTDVWARHAETMVDGISAGRTVIANPLTRANRPRSLYFHNRRSEPITLQNQDQTPLTCYDTHVLTSLLDRRRCRIIAGQRHNPVFLSRNQHCDPQGRVYYIRGARNKSIVPQHNSFQQLSDTRENVRDTTDYD